VNIPGEMPLLTWWFSRSLVSTFCKMALEYMGKLAKTPQANTTPERRQIKSHLLFITLRNKNSAKAFPPIQQ